MMFPPPSVPLFCDSVAHDHMRLVSGGASGASVMPRFIAICAKASMNFADIVVNAITYFGALAMRAIGIPSEARGAEGDGGVGLLMVNRNAAPSTPLTRVLLSRRIEALSDFKNG